MGKQKLQNMNGGQTMLDHKSYKTILKSIRNLTGSRWSEKIIWVMWDLWVVLEYGPQHYWLRHVKSALGMLKSGKERADLIVLIFLLWKLHDLMRLLICGPISWESNVTPRFVAVDLKWRTNERLSFAFQVIRYKDDHLLCAAYWLHSWHFLHPVLNQWQIYVGRSRRLVRNCGSIPQLSYSVDLWRSRDVKQL